MILTRPDCGELRGMVVLARLYPAGRVVEARAFECSKAGWSWS